MVEERAVFLVPIGPVPAELVDHLAALLGMIFGLSSRVATAMAIPSAAHDRRRGQYMGGGILAMLARLDIPNAERVLGVIDADCYAPGLNFILGQASIGGRDAFIALPRLRQSFYGLPEDQALFRERALKEAVHELGHTYGLQHCPNLRCVMHFSNSLRDTDAKQAKWCSRCATQVRDLTGRT
jgi:archaemetzincin